MKVEEIMTRNPCSCSPSDSLRDAARLMRDFDCGAVPVVENGGLLGIVTDRDLAIRALAAGRSADTKVSEVLTSNLCCCSPDDDIGVVEKVMADNQVRRVPIVDDDGHCVGIVAQADLARAAHDTKRLSDREVAIVVERISEPARPSMYASERPSSLEQSF
jgi:CBS domain-containing protein